jgi:uncharacterized membrane protein YcaP (DUF421 family)
MIANKVLGRGQTMGILEMVIRTVVVFISVYVWSRILGKKLISQMTFFDFVAGISLGSIAGSIMYSANISLTTAIIGLSLFALLAFILDLLAVSSFKARKILDDEPTLVVKDGNILEEGMRKARLNMDELLFQLRQKNIFYLDEVELAYFETNGKVSALKKPEYKPVTRKDLQLLSSSRGQAQTFIIDGQILENSLASIGKDEDWVKDIIKSHGANEISDVAIAQVDENNKVYIDTRKDPVH